ncbi:MAG TPA: bifunctional phosphopantothenoylcysteine decarboxylase/phosphopantothenate--cysteine ligase CoaBC [Polyangiaceae bacterium]|nr:bifunctional phosphopantothenoylcysteine decarboxylase/phosphopantothenate--cysteine ligase CoaBC [Polyangiaceae bacterium]
MTEPRSPKTTSTRRAKPGTSGSEPATEAPAGGRLRDKLVTLCVTGSVAAYKAVLLLRALKQEGAEVEVVLSSSGAKFVGPATFAGLTGRSPHTSMFDEHVAGELHVELARRSDLLLIAPATADVLARLAQGRADDLITATTLCATCPVLVAPAMHPSMWSHPATQRNVQALAADQRVGFVGPVEGEVASGDIGIGRMAEPDVILSFVIAQLSPATLRGRHIVVSAGPTAEDIDPVRFISNRSSGKMGFALAERAAAFGAKVTLVAGPVALATPAGVTRIDVRSASAMRGAIWQALKPDLSGADALIMTAAVADYRPAETHASKLKRGETNIALELVPNEDLLAEIGAARKSQLPVLVGFALETETDERLIAAARAKLAKKRVDFVVANHPDSSIGRDSISVSLVGVREAEALGPVAKRDAADRILALVASELGERSAQK